MIDFRDFDTHQHGQSSDGLVPLVQPDAFLIGRIKRELSAREARMDERRAELCWQRYERDLQQRSAKPQA